ncbi:tRNA 2-selenouridine(34) synthase MnmH [Candidatus Woesearchaeota archaeon]|nr:tRNA 2-selenouridine(34) synthase MnmH [Candidatus Woesearchaeota archaeon]
MFATITVQQALQHKEAIFIDTRTPQEFAEDCLPNAINIPIFSDDERAMVGTIYKQISREKAIEKGIEFFSQKLPDFMNKINTLIEKWIEKGNKKEENKTENNKKDKELIIYCWRGGMRSKSVTALLDSLGYNVKQLEGGHKEYRAYVRERLQNYQLKAKLVVLWGLTCTGKTELIHQLPCSIDLEGLAQHRGSLYGAIGLQPRSQKKFENLFLQELEKLNDKEYILVEGESRKIGDVQIPAFFYKAMLNGKHILITQSIEKRAEAAVKEYFGEKNVAEIKKVTEKLWKVIGKQRKEEVLQLLETGKFVEAARILLEFYYDPLYSHTLKKMQFVGEVRNESVEEGVKGIQEILTNFGIPL